MRPVEQELITEHCNRPNYRGCRRRHSNSTTPVATDTFSDANCARHWNANQDVAMLFHQLMQAVPFAAQDENCWLGIIHFAVQLAAALIQAIDPEAAFLQILERLVYVSHADHGQVLQRSGGRFGDGFGQSGAARRSGTITALAPAACAVRIMAPRLCGSSTPSKTISNRALGST